MKNFIKALIITALIIINTGCITVYKNSTVMQYKGSAELQTDSMKINLNNKAINIEELK